MKEIKNKFALEKFQIAKLKNLNFIKGGDGGNDPDTITDTVNNSGEKCVNGPVRPQPKPQPKPDPISFTPH